VTLEGVEWSAVIPGAYLRLGSDIVIQVTRYTAPCTNIAPSFRDHDHVRVSQKRHPGDSRVYARVLREGGLVSGDPARILSDDEAQTLIGAR
jgi:MOSC domain-containing protein YiiM